MPTIPRLAGLLRLLCIGLPMAFASVAAQPIAEHDLKAAFVFNFVAFTEWPSGSAPDGSPLVACVGASSGLRRPLESLAGQRVKSRTFQVRAQASPDDVGTCDVVIVEAADRQRVPTVLRAIGGRSVLTIGDAPNSHRDGLAVSLAIENNRLRFRVNLQAARSAQLEISSKLLRLAQAVE